MEANINIASIWESNKKEAAFFKELLFASKTNSKKILTPTLITENCSGISLLNSKIKSLIFSTDMALIENNDADAVLAVYPFSPSPKIMKVLIDFSDKPVICGIGGGLTQGKNSLEMAITAEAFGAAAIIVNQPFKNKDIEAIKKKIKIPIISSVSNINFSFQDRINAGVNIFHVTAGINTASIIEHIKYKVPCFPIIATGGKTYESIYSSIISGANAIVLTPPSCGELFKSIMNQYRLGIMKPKNN